MFIVADYVSLTCLQSRLVEPRGAPGHKNNTKTINLPGPVLVTAKEQILEIKDSYLKNLLILVFHFIEENSGLCSLK